MSLLIYSLKSVLQVAIMKHATTMLHCSKLPPCMHERPQLQVLASCLQEFRSIRGDDPGAEGLSQEDQDSLDLTKLLGALQTGGDTAPAQCAPAVDAHLACLISLRRKS